MAAKREKPLSQDVFWADKLATEIMERCKTLKKTPVVKAGASPSGAKHIGNLFDVMKGYMVYKALVHKGADAKFSLTHDDRDPLRTLPSRLPDMDGKWVETKGAIEKKMSAYIGHPYSSAPDPFECHYTWAEHFSKVWENGILASGIGDSEISFVSNNDLYLEGKFDPYFRLVFKNLADVRKLIAQFQESITNDYVPVLVICENCGKVIGQVKDFTIEERTVGYACEGRELAGKYKIEGCGHKGETSWDNCKLVWRFEWPAQWGILNVDFEAFGKDHAEGSWPSGTAIAEKIYRIKPPLYHIYEFILVNGEKMSSRRGNVFIAQEILDIIEPEIFMYFYTKRSGKQRDLDIRHVYRLVDEFEKTERIYFGIEKETSKQREATIRREYESSMSSVPEKPPLRIDYQFAAVISQLAPDLKFAMKMLRDSGHIGGQLSKDDEKRIAFRLSCAKNWVKSFAKEQEIKIGLDKDLLPKLTEKQRAAIIDVEELLHRDANRDEMHRAFYDIAKKHGISSQDFFRAFYLILIGRESGPRLAPFILALGKDRVHEIINEVKKFERVF